MHLKEELDFLLELISCITARYSKLSKGIPDLKIVVDNTRENSELKKTPRRLLNFPLRVSEIPGI